MSLTDCPWEFYGYRSTACAGSSVPEPGYLEMGRRGCGTDQAGQDSLVRWQRCRVSNLARRVGGEEGAAAPRPGQLSRLLFVPLGPFGRGAGRTPDLRL